MARVPTLVASPYAGDIAKNTSYAALACLDSLTRGEAPLAPHLLYPQFLDESIEQDRETGMLCGLAWLSAGFRLAVYTDLGISPGMEAEIAHAERIGAAIHYRSIGD